MKNIIPLTLFWTVALFGWSCRADVEEIRPYPVTQEELSLFLKQVPDPSTTTTIHLSNLNEDKILTTSGGIRIFLTDVDQLFSVANAPTPVACSTCEDLKIEVTIAMNRGDILARELPTVTVEDSLLESGGMVHLKVYCGATELQLLPGRTIKVQLPASDTKDNMRIHTTVSDDNGFLGWQNTGQEVFKADWPGTGGTGTVQGYELILSKLGWSNCARPLTNAGVTPFCLNLQSNHTGLNTQAYLIFENVLVVAPLMFDNTTHSFCFPNIPAGYPVKVVSVAKLDTEYWLGATTTETGTNSMLPMQPQKQEAVEVLGYLRGL